MNYLLLENGVAYAQQLSAAMWGLTRPAGDNTTKFYVGWLEHEDGRAALQVLGEAIPYETEEGPSVRFTESQPVHKDCDSAAFREAIANPKLTTYEEQEVDGETVRVPVETPLTPAVTEPEADAIQAGIEAAKGSRMSFLAVVLNSPSLSPKLKTKSDLEADGWFPEPEE